MTIDIERLKELELEILIATDVRDIDEETSTEIQELIATVREQWAEIEAQYHEIERLRMDYHSLAVLFGKCKNPAGDVCNVCAQEEE